MARTFVFLYVFTVPFAMLSDKSSDIAHCFMVFLLTYGFVGLEVVAIELDNPFGNDPNDFNCRCVSTGHIPTRDEIWVARKVKLTHLFCLFISALAMTAYEDAYLTILDVDGPEWTDRLRKRMHDASATITSTELSWLLSPTI